MPSDKDVIRLLLGRQDFSGNPGDQAVADAWCDDNSPKDQEEDKENEPVAKPAVKAPIGKDK